MFRVAAVGRLLPVTLLSALGAAFVLPGTALAQTDRGKKYALLVGVRHYDSAKLEPLRFTENDVEELAGALTAEGAFASLRVLTTTRGEKKSADRPTGANIRAAIKVLLARKTRDDTVLVALSGHGISARVGGKDDSYFCPSDAQLNDNDTLLSLAKLFADLDGCGAGVKLLLVDACRNDPSLGRNVDVDSLPRLPRGTAALFSCKTGERAFESPKLGTGHGIFFFHVIEGIKGKAKNAKGEITWGRLVEHVTDAVSEDVPRLIGGGARQTPELKVNLTGRSPVLMRPSEANRLFRLAMACQVGQGRPLDYARAARLHQEAMDRGHPVAPAALGILCCAGAPGFPRDPEKGVRLCRAAAPRLQKEAEQGNSPAQFWLGELLLNGIGVERNLRQGIHWYRQAAENGVAVAQNNLADHYVSGDGVPKDEKEAVRWYRKAADQDLCWSHFYLGFSYAIGRGVEKDEREAARWYRKAAEKGVAVAQNNLADAYYFGRGVAKDYGEAARWFRKAAELGRADAQINLGYQYERGEGVKKDLKEAVSWYRKAAEQGSAVGQTNLGWMYQHGLGVARDMKEARKWYQKAADQGHAKARQRLEELRK
jgi:TPR repeat protein